MKVFINGGTGLGASRPAAGDRGAATREGDGNRWGGPLSAVRGPAGRRGRNTRGLAEQQFASKLGAEHGLGE
jgi:hypothetical protein